MRRLFIGILLMLSIGTARAQEETPPAAEETLAAPPPTEEPAPTEPAPSGEETAAPAPKKQKRKPAVDLDGGSKDSSALANKPRSTDAGSPTPKLAATDGGSGAPKLAGTPVSAADAGAPLAGKALPASPIQAPSALSTEAQGAFKVARAFFDGLLAGDARGAAALTSAPFDLDDKRILSKDDVYQRLVKELRDKRTDLLTLYGIEVLSPADMEKKYGKPPARLSTLQWKNPNTYVAVANLSGHAAIAVLRSGGSDSWHVVAYTD
ncbi:MAG: hypothetical protein ACT4TC_08820 [Myxococcaceae bacterium]